MEEARKIKQYENLPMDRVYLSHSHCRKVANELIDKNEWHHADREKMAREIYGHAWAYYRFSFLKRLPVFYKKVYSHLEDGIDLADVIDRFQAAWNVIWYFK